MTHSSSLLISCIVALLLTLQCRTPILSSYTQYAIDENSLTYQNDTRTKRYIDVQKINEIEKEKVLLMIKSQVPLYIKAAEEISMKSGWRIQGKTGQEELIKEPSLNTSAILLKNTDQVQVANFKLSYESYLSAEHFNGLIEIDNESTLGKRIDIRKMTLMRHYSAIWVKRGRNIRIQDCRLDSNAHQIRLGFLAQDPTQTPHYRVDNLTIKGCSIQNSLGGGSNGIKTLSNCRGILIKNNIIANNNHDGIDLFPGGVEVEIVGNTIRDNKIHGIEVKMTNARPPIYTGQIEQVIIKGNLITHNGNSGIACLDQADTYFPRGVEILKNQIDSNGHYGIHAEFPLKIRKNELNGNGLKEFPVPRQAYSGIYLLDVRPEDSSFVLKNTIINQAPWQEEGEVFWMNINNPSAYVQILDNRLIITSADSTSPNLQKHGINIYARPAYFNLREVQRGNRFSDGFTEKVRVKN